jgi:hypothetical protein
MKYSRMLFLPKNDSPLVNMLPILEHAVKNNENMNGYILPLVFIL